MPFRNRCVLLNQSHIVTQHVSVIYWKSNHTISLCKLNYIVSLLGPAQVTPCLTLTGVHWVCFDPYKMNCDCCIVCFNCLGWCETCFVFLCASFPNCMWWVIYCSVHPHNSLCHFHVPCSWFCPLVHICCHSTIPLPHPLQEWPKWCETSKTPFNFQVSFIFIVYDGYVCCLGGCWVLAAWWLVVCHLAHNVFIIQYYNIIMITFLTYWWTIAIFHVWKPVATNHEHLGVSCPLCFSSCITIITIITMLCRPTWLCLSPSCSVAHYMLHNPDSPMHKVTVPLHHIMWWWCPENGRSLLRWSLWRLTWILWFHNQYKVVCCNRLLPCVLAESRKLANLPTLGCPNWSGWCSHAAAAAVVWLSCCCLQDNDQCLICNATFIFFAFYFCPHCWELDSIFYSQPNNPQLKKTLWWGSVLDPQNQKVVLRYLTNCCGLSSLNPHCQFDAPWDLNHWTTWLVVHMCLVSWDCVFWMEFVQYPFFPIKFLHCEQIFLGGGCKPIGDCVQSIVMLPPKCQNMFQHTVFVAWPLYPAILHTHSECESNICW